MIIACKIFEKQCSVFDLWWLWLACVIDACSEVSGVQLEHSFWGEYWLMLTPVCMSPFILPKPNHKVTFLWRLEQCLVT